MLPVEALNSTIAKTILTDHPTAKDEPLAGHPFGAFNRHDAATAKNTHVERHYGRVMGALSDGATKLLCFGRCW